MFILARMHIAEVLQVYTQEFLNTLRVFFQVYQLHDGIKVLIFHFTNLFHTVCLYDIIYQRSYTYVYNMILSNICNFFYIYCLHEIAKLCAHRYPPKIFQNLEHISIYFILYHLLVQVCTWIYPVYTYKIF